MTVFPRFGELQFGRDLEGSRNEVADFYAEVE
jgi:hypothetical protein